MSVSDLLHWFGGRTLSDVIESYFIHSDMPDIFMTEEERVEHGAGDSQAMQYRPTYYQDEHGNEFIDGVPMGKYVG